MPGMPGMPGTNEHPQQALIDEADKAVKAIIFNLCHTRCPDSMRAIEFLLRQSLRNVDRLHQCLANLD